MTFSVRHTHAFYFLAGALLVIVVLLLTGAAPLQQIGRYRMSVISRDRFTDVFVIDTTSGIVKYVGKDEGKPFDQIKSR